MYRRRLSERKIPFSDWRYALGINNGLLWWLLMCCLLLLMMIWCTLTTTCNSSSTCFSGGIYFLQWIMKNKSQAVWSGVGILYILFCFTNTISLYPKMLLLLYYHIIYSIIMVPTWKIVLVKFMHIYPCHIVFYVCGCLCECMCLHMCAHLFLCVRMYVNDWILFEWVMHNSCRARKICVETEMMIPCLWPQRWFAHDIAMHILISAECLYANRQ